MVPLAVSDRSSIAERAAMSRSRRLLSVTLIAVGVHTLIFLATALYLIFLGRNDIAAVSWSLTFYYENASKVMAGQVPYRDFLFEYPPLSFPLFLIPRLLVPDLDGYKVAFVAEMLLFDAAAIYMLARQVSESAGMEAVPGRLAWYTVFCAGLSPLVIGRFELAPMLLAFAAARWWFAGRGSLGGVAAGLGALMKVFPGAVAAPAVVCELSRLRKSGARGAVAFLATLVVGLAVWFGVAGRHVLDSLGYHAERGLEVGSLYGGALFLRGMLAGTEVPWVFDYKAFHVAPEWGARLIPLALPLQAAALVLVMARFWRSGMTEGMRYSTAAVLAFVITGKVLSPQYLIWLFPFLAALDGRTGRLARRIFLLGCLTTAMLYPGPGFVMVLDHQAGAILLLNLRNVLLVWLLAVLLYGPASDGPADRSTGSARASGS
jgi:Glycosyltransferase family 87